MLGKLPAQAALIVEHNGQGLIRGQDGDKGPLMEMTVNQVRLKVASQLGKRYRCQKCGTEALCTKAGDGEMTCDGQPMQVQEAKPIPSSD